MFSSISIPEAAPLDATCTEYRITTRLLGYAWRYRWLWLLLVLSTAAMAGFAGYLVLLVRDVLDTQIVDVVGQRLARVADVVLTPTADGHLELIGVEVGFGGVLRRLHLPVLRSGEDVVVWSDLHLTSERGHAVQLATPRAAPTTW